MRGWIDFWKLLGANPEWGAWGRYGFAVVLGALAAWLRWGLHSFWGHGFQFITFYPAIALVAMLAGGRPALVTTMVSVVAAAYLILEPPGAAVGAFPERVALAFFLLAGVGISALGGLLRAARARLVAAELLREAKDALERERNVLQTVMHGATNAHLAYVDREFNFVRVNETYARRCGYRPEEMVGKNHFALFAHAENEAIFARVRDTGEAAQFQDKPFVYAAHPEAGVTYWDWTLTPVKDAEGRVEGLVISLFETTERKRAEEALRQAKEQLALHAGKLELTVQERTARLQEMVGELEHFSYSITHDMRAPLRAMRGFAGLVMETCAACTQGEAKEMLKRIATAADRMDQLIVDALNYSKAVRQELPLAPMDVGALLGGMLETYPELQPGRAEIKVEGNLPWVMGNEAGLTQCFSNLLGNAVKFVAPGVRPQIRIWADVNPKSEIGKPPPGVVRIWVEDNGIGIPRTILPRVFEMFSRGHGGYEGTGIGLALVRKVMDRMGGKVGVESEEGKGSRFWLELKTGDK